MLPIVIFILILIEAVASIVVSFVLANIAMFQTPIDLVIWKYTWNDIPFLYFVGGSFLLGALIVGISVIILDTKRQLNIRALRKELKQLQKAVQEAKAALPKEEVVSPQRDEISASEASANATPEEVTKSFEDAVESGDFYSKNDDTPESTQDTGETSLGDAKKNLPEQVAVEAEVVDAKPKEHETSQSTLS